MSVRSAIADDPKQATDLLDRIFLRSWSAPLLIGLIVVLGYGIAPARLPLVGEETCRARHGIEMAATGDWIIATQQGVPILDRPPLQYWVNAIIHKWIHPLDPMTLRLSMFVFTLTMSLGIWWYARGFFGPAGAFFAGVAYPTTGHVLDLGRRAETDGLFTLLLGAAMLIWHYGYTRKWPAVWTWGVGLGLGALATLTKGTQAPVALFGTIYIFLLIKRDWKTLFSFLHFAGLLLYLGLIAVWQIPFMAEAGWEGTRSTWLDPGAGRVDFSLGALLHQLVTFPGEVAIAALPWSVCLTTLLVPRFWRTLDSKQRSCMLYALIGMATVFVPVWFTAEGHQRYVMPLYPLLAVVACATVDRSLASQLPHYLRKAWWLFGLICGPLMVGATLFFTVATVLAAVDGPEWAHMLAQPVWLLAVLFVVGVGGGLDSIRRVMLDGQANAMFTTTVVMAAIMAFYNGVVINITLKAAARPGPQIQHVRDSLPDDATLVSFGRVHHKFVYWYEEDIPVLLKPESSTGIPPDLEYFAIDVYRDDPLDLPFEWEELTRINVDRTRTTDPEMVVVVGRIMR